MAAGISSVIYWFRRDLRIADNVGFLSATQQGLPVVPVYVLSHWYGAHAWTGAGRQRFLCGCLASLSENLGAIGGKLVIRQGEAVEELHRLILESGAVAVHFSADPDPFGKETEGRIRDLCTSLGIGCHAHHDHSLHSPGEVLTQSGNPYQVFTPYFRNWLQLPKPVPVGKPRSILTPDSISSLPLPTLATWGLEAKTGTQIPTAGERAARSRLKLAVSDILPAYAARRDIPAADGTSRLSQDLRFGLISARTVFAEAMKARATANAQARIGIDEFIRQLAWREFFFAILHHFPEVLEVEFNPVWRGLPWDYDDHLLKLWQEGRTGFPIVDAGMRELRTTGHMHNRVRMITAMFLTKDLHLDWRLGESYFMQQLIDGEIASNNGGWQWSAGTGADAAPYFRIQNPWAQTSKYDPEGLYIKRWLPELADVPAKQLLSPPKSGRSLAPGYPLPCIDHAEERLRTLDRFNRHRHEHGRH